MNLQKTQCGLPAKICSKSGLKNCNMIRQVIRSLIEMYLFLVISLLEVIRNVLLFPYFMLLQNNIDIAIQRYLEIVNTDLRLIYEQE